MQIVLAIVLAITAYLLFTSKFDNKVLERAASVSGIIATAAAIIVLAFYTFPSGKTQEEQATAIPQVNPTTFVAETLAPLPTQSITSVPSETLASTTPITFPDYSFGVNQGCLDTQYWSLYPGDGIIPDNNDCWSSINSGFIVQDKKIFLTPPISSEEQSKSIYLPITPNALISFVFQMQKLNTQVNKQAYVRIGVVPANPPDPSKGKFLAYHFPPNSYEYIYPIFMQGSSNGQPFDLPLKIDGDHAQNVVISIQSQFLSISISDQFGGLKTSDKEILGFNDKLLWIDYSIPANSGLSANISDFAVEVK